VEIGSEMRRMQVKCTSFW